MLFNSYEFILAFLPLTALIFFLLGRKGFFQGAIAWLVCASLFFYGWWEPKYLVLLCGSIAVNFLVGSSLQRLHNRDAKLSYRKWLLTLGIALNVVTLGYFKYANFIVDNIQNITGIDYHLDKIILPLAISFFTFQQIAFVVDAYKGQIKDLSLLHYCLFVTFFPQLIAGPIVHHSYVLPQFAKPETFSPRVRNIVIGFVIFTLGLFKKVMLADSVSVYATPVFDMANSGGEIGMASAWLGVLAYTCQLYFDFSGYSDMAIGLGRIFGISLPLNFNSPYKSVNIIEFWTRWHITLSQFLRGYLYYPMVLGRSSTTLLYMALVFVMLLGGLWHGAGWTYIIWGGIHGLYLVANYLWRTLRGARRSHTSLARFGAGVLTFFAVVISLVPFRTESIAGTIHMLRSMFGIGGIQLPLQAGNLPFMNHLVDSNIVELSGNLAATPAAGIALTAALLAIIFLWPNTQQLVRNFLDTKYYRVEAGLLHQVTWKPNLAWAIIIGLIFISTIMVLDRPTEFLYFQF